MSRITEYTPEVGKAIAEAVKKCGYLSLACDMVGVKRRRAYYWMELGHAGKEPYEEFVELVLAARASLAPELLKLVLQDKGGPAFAAERIFPAEFGQPTKNAQAAMQLLMDEIFPLLSASAQQEVVDAFALVERRRSGSGDPGVADAETAGAGAPEAIDVDGESVGQVANPVLPSRTDTEAG